MTKIKICGITNLEDAEKAASLGADALGYIFAGSPRQISPETARPIIERLKGRVLNVGVFVNESPDEVDRISRYCALDALQLHGEESPEYCMHFTKPVIKAFRIKDDASLRPIPSYQGIFAYLLDTFSKKNRGGTGQTFDWGLAAKAKQFGKPIILSGGLGPSNIERAVEAVRPYGVDISSSIENGPAKKDHRSMGRVISLIKALD